MLLAKLKVASPTPPATVGAQWVVDQYNALTFDPNTGSDDLGFFGQFESMGFVPPG